MVCKWPSPIFNIGLNLQGIGTLTPLIASKYSNPITLAILLYLMIFNSVVQVSLIFHIERETVIWKKIIAFAQYIYTIMQILLRDAF